MKVETLTSHEVAQLQALASQLGVREAARRVGTNAESYARAVGRLPTRRGTVAVIRSNLRDAETR